MSYYSEDEYEPPEEPRSTSNITAVYETCDDESIYNVAEKRIKFPTHASFSIIASEILEAMQRIESIPPVPEEDELEAGSGSGSLSDDFDYMTLCLATEPHEWAINLVLTTVTTANIFMEMERSTYITVLGAGKRNLYTDSRVKALLTVELFLDAENPAGLFRT
ncbi:hypothetical protein H4R34_002593 [Dimargaris verticillata]|uniref:Uncharacterized protein n=1 Tax=Dimargaris verticillata TaxID=2761393 RepID=A0A9W8EDF1_9FUNG|nr:hypothetical protein H4R34_002593 [Dimargaris verticillata]